MKSLRTTKRSRADHILCESPRLRRRVSRPYAVGVAGAFVCSASARAGTDLLGAGRLTATGAVTAMDGSAGGGINPWAVIAGYGADRPIGGSAFYTHLTLPNFKLNAYGAAIGLFDRAELSYARQDFSLGSTGAQRDGAIAGLFGAPVSGLPAPLQLVPTIS